MKIVYICILTIIIGCEVKTTNNHYYYADTLKIMIDTCINNNNCTITTQVLRRLSNNTDIVIENAQVFLLDNQHNNIGIFEYRDYYYRFNTDCSQLYYVQCVINDSTLRVVSYLVGQYGVDRLESNEYSLNPINFIGYDIYIRQFYIEE